MRARSFRRYLVRFEAEGEAGLLDRRLENRSSRGASADEVLALQERYRERYGGWDVRHFFGHYRSEGGQRSYGWVKKQLRAGGLVERGKRKGTHRKKRDRKPLPGMMIHQDGSRHEWLAGQWHDLIVTMDDATGEVYSMFLVEEEGTASSFIGMREVIESRGVPSSFHSDRGSHDWTTPEAGGQVDKANPTQFGRAMRQMNIQRMAADSPEARGRSRTGCRRNWRFAGSRAWKRRTGSSGRNSARATTRSFRWRRVKKGQLLSRGLGATCRTSCVSTMSGQRCRTTA